MSSGRAWAAALVLLIACSGGMPRPTADDALRASAEWPGTSLGTLDEGRDLYLRKCGACHRPHEPARLPEARWRETMDDMARRSGLDARERDRVLSYLVTMSRFR